MKLISDIIEVDDEYFSGYQSPIDFDLISSQTMNEDECWEQINGKLHTIYGFSSDPEIINEKTVTRGLDIALKDYINLERFLNSNTENSYIETYKLWLEKIGHSLHKNNVNLDSNFQTATLTDKLKQKQQELLNETAMFSDEISQLSPQEKVHIETALLENKHNFSILSKFRQSRDRSVFLSWSGFQYEVCAFTIGNCNGSLNQINYKFKSPYILKDSCKGDFVSELLFRYITIAVYTLSNIKAESNLILYSMCHIASELHSNIPRYIILMLYSNLFINLKCFW
jgi:hypothetical protein